MIKKIILLGKYGVGKTSLVSRFVDNTFSDNYLSSIGVNISKKNLALADFSLSLMIWDIAGEPEISNITASYLKGATGAIFVIDVTRPHSYDHLQRELEALVRISGDIEIVVAANKVDLKVGAREYGKESIAGRVPVFETSAKTGENVQSMFEALGKMIYHKIHRNEIKGSKVI